MTVTQQSGGAVGSRSGSLYDVLELILDRGLVIDAFVRVSLVGIELLRIDARVVVASVDTYLRFAEACNRLDLEGKGGVGLPDLVGSMEENGAKGKSKGAISGAVESLTESFQGNRHQDDAEKKEPARRPARRSRQSEES